MNYLPEFSDLTSSTPVGETHFQSSMVLQGTPSARSAVSPWNESIREIMALPYHKGYPCPSKESGIVACRIVELAYQISEALGWKPNRSLVTSNNEGEIVLEWWHRARKITFYVEADQITYVRVWGADISQEMDDGRVQDGKHFLQIWRWLHG